MSLKEAELAQLRIEVAALRSSKSPPAEPSRATAVAGDTLVPRGLPELLATEDVTKLLTDDTLPAEIAAAHARLDLLRPQSAERETVANLVRSLGLDTDGLGNARVLQADDLERLIRLTVLTRTNPQLFIECKSLKSLHVLKQAEYKQLGEERKALEALEVDDKVQQLAQNQDKLDTLLLTGMLCCVHAHYLRRIHTHARTQHAHSES